MKNNKEKKYENIIKILQKKGIINQMAFKHELVKMDLKNDHNNNHDNTIDSYFVIGNNNNNKVKKKKVRKRLNVFKHTYEMRFDGDNADELRKYFRKYKNGLPDCIDKDTILMAIKGKRKIRQLL